MDRREYFERLDSTAEDPADLFEHFEERSTAGVSYHALPDARHGVERGTVIVEDADAVVRGYPSVPRVFVLDPGLPAFFDAGSVVIEEKFDGFNVRIAAVDADGGSDADSGDGIREEADEDASELLAFTRSGYVCPYTTARSQALLDPAPFFADYADLVLCAELIGPETPYTTHDYDGVDSHAIRVFGIRDRESGAPLPIAERRELCAAYGFPQPRTLGRGDPEEAPSAVRAAIDDLDAAGREGVVVKSSDGTEMVKYTTEAQHHDELAHAFALPFDHGREFLFSRVIREGFQAAEFDEDDDRLRERARDLGESILLPMVETVRAVARGETVGERHTVRADPGTVEDLLAYLRDHGLTIDVKDDRREDGDRVVEFVKVADATSDRTEYYLEGGTRDE